MHRLGDILNASAEYTRTRQATLPNLEGCIAYTEVTFTYPGTEKRALRDITLAIPAGGSIGIVGKSGSGKSALTKLAQRFYLPDSGRITLDGIDLSLADPAWLRRQIGVVLQENLLFNASIHKNIALTNPSMSMEQIIHVAKLAGAHDFIMELGEGYETIIAEQGSASASPSPARWTTNPKNSSKTTYAKSDAAAPSSSSRTAYQPCATASKSSSWTRAKFASAANMQTSCKSQTAITPACTRCKAASHKRQPRHV